MREERQGASCRDGRVGGQWGPPVHPPKPVHGASVTAGRGAQAQHQPPAHRPQPGPAPPHVPRGRPGRDGDRVCWLADPADPGQPQPPGRHRGHHFDGGCGGRPRAARLGAAEQPRWPRTGRVGHWRHQPPPAAVCRCVRGPKNGTATWTPSTPVPSHALCPSFLTPAPQAPASRRRRSTPRAAAPLLRAPQASDWVCLGSCMPAPLPQARLWVAGWRQAPAKLPPVRPGPARCQALGAGSSSTRRALRTGRPTPMLGSRCQAACPWTPCPAGPASAGASPRSKTWSLCSAQTASILPGVVWGRGGLLEGGRRGWPDGVWVRAGVWVWWWG